MKRYVFSLNRVLRVRATQETVARQALRGVGTAMRFGHGPPQPGGKISDGADVATLQLENPPPKKASILELDARTDATVTGEPVVLIGYPTGIEGILARAGSDVAQKIAENSNDAQNVSRIMSQLASVGIRVDVLQPNSDTEVFVAELPNGKQYLLLRSGLLRLRDEDSLSVEGIERLGVTR